MPMDADYGFTRESSGSSHNTAMLKDRVLRLENAVKKKPSSSNLKHKPGIGFRASVTAPFSCYAKDMVTR